MDHNYAKENHIAEGYILNDLSPKERDEYEEHYFSCPLCAEEVKAASDFIINAKQVIQAEAKEKLYRDTKRHSIWGSWLNWRSIMQPLPAMACLMVIFLGGFSGYQNRVTIPELRGMTAPQLISRPVKMHQSKGPVSTVVAHKGKWLALDFDIPKDQYPSYNVSVLTSSNLEKLSFTNISVADLDHAFEIVVPADRFETGRYLLVIDGFDAHKKGEVDRIPFDIKFQD